MTKDNASKSSDRRSFLKTTSVAATGAALAGSVARTAHAAGLDEIKVVLIGCGGRGSGAIVNLFNTEGNVKLVAVADAFPQKAEGLLNSLRKRKQYAEKVAVTPENIYTDLNGYKAAMDVECDLVVIATPPAFKPQQFEHAVKKGRHVFMEKPVASDAPGVRRVLESVKESKKKDLLVAIGLQRRHQPNYLETVRRIHDGEIGDVISQQVYWNGGGIWYRNRTDDQNEMAFQCNNWYHFNWLSGDQICEQHIHNLDIGCWVKGEYPVECNGMGGRGQRMDGDPTKSQINDHTFCEFTFADGSKMFSQGRHLKGAWTHVGEHVQGSKGTADPSGWLAGANEWKFDGPNLNGHQQEQHDLIAALMRGDIYNEGEYGALSTFTAILGREACYSGKVLKWDELLENGRNLAPNIDDLTLESQVPESARPDDEGRYPIPVPGSYNPFA
ncbi:MULTISPECIES: Gfo/Idh/MocA family oxidoreductase [Crateriforma]|uniref:Glucose--fructose oxidoreductase n=1 Tax=Crateriforma conspicua TaxID=2527996 RepID=A0A5C6FQK6_9PLAN|nr:MULTISPECIES: Gfo/Idh/MocA family oxidoreductase [Crateriforma]QDV65232.1 Glucose--fructose oxidoreductase precursor [Crateriforma conspicua]TWT70627.1 Glucose--fructose oxidoreductase precursor [Crateriforma conspicua]TWU65432.1 Glucose--fructose oxidoreductase precursor [Crateriforma conspicua]